jgi:hypothetical protein
LRCQSTTEISHISTTPSSKEPTKKSFSRVPRTQQKNWVKKLWTEKNWGKLSTRKKKLGKKQGFLAQLFTQFF